MKKDYSLEKFYHVTVYKNIYLSKYTFRSKYPETLAK